MRIFINTTPPTNTGGVANHYKGLKKYWQEDVYYNYIGSRSGIPGGIILIYDLLKFAIRLILINPDIVILNPSLGETALLRDRLFLKISTLLGNKTVLFFHGWDDKQAERIDTHPGKFREKFNSADGFLVLASNFKNKLQEWGITRPIYLTTTKVDNTLIDDFDISAKKLNSTILFLARIEPEKGIFETLQAYTEIKEQRPEAKLIIAGSGSALSDAMAFVENNNLPDVEFKGYVTGEDLKSVYKQSDIYLFPTSHGEGMPTSVLEAMAFGLPVVSRPVGGISDFFENDKMGYLIQSLDSSEFARKLMQLLENPAKIKEISLYNHQYARKNFLASNVAGSLEKICSEILTLNLNK